ncbi:MULTISPECIES: TetR/AcrR family transcriptional regulator [Acidobacterium]|uniref:TetR/AcrR family transcriptional regulator n=1 Tax=Acidobacterium TaxID=33973 RepID=UPI0011D13887|nr:MULTISPECIES: TetR/AcrR family transcriptional regulator [Acidobacterium]
MARLVGMTPKPSSKSSRKPVKAGARAAKSAQKKAARPAAKKTASAAGKTTAKTATKAATKATTKTEAKAAAKKTAKPRAAAAKPKVKAGGKASQKKAAASAGFAPQQERSQETHRKLMHAAIKVVSKQGLQSATIPKIAEAAGVSAANVYRRFEDKDALLQAAFLDMLEHAARTNREELTAEKLEGIPFAQALPAMMAAMYSQNRQTQAARRALRQFLEQSEDKAFQKQAANLIADSYMLLVDLLMVYRNEIRHPEPEKALRFAMMQAGTAFETITLAGESVWERVLEMDDDAVFQEMLRSLAAYLMVR